MANINKLEAVLNIYMIDGDELKILLGRKKNDPYKGYWELPNSIVVRDKTTEETINNIATDFALLPTEVFISCRQAKFFDTIDRKIDERVVAITYNCITDSRIVLENQQEHSKEDLNWFSLSSLPKLAYDHETIISESLNVLKDDILYKDALVALFPSDFTLPELQRVYEMVTKKVCDRRNFRKKFIEKDMLIDTGYKNSGGTGRPAKLYRFKNINKEDII